MKVLIIEDEVIASEKLAKMLLDLNENIVIAGKTGSIKDSVKWLTEKTADLIFLDIQLSDGLSFSIFEQVQVNTPVIFTTAYDHYAIKAFQVNSIAYLLKPIKKSELIESLRKYKSFKSAFSIDFEELLLSIAESKSKFKTRFLVQAGDKMRKIETEEIAYFFVREKWVFLKTFQGNQFTIGYTLEDLERKLNQKQFFRINRKIIVNVKSIINMVSHSRSRVKLFLNPNYENGEDLVVSIERSPDFKKWLDE